MNDPLSHVLPDFLHFYQLQGTQIVLLLGIIMLFGSIGGRLFQKLRIPQVVGYIVIGIIIGSSGFQVLGSKTIEALNPISTVSLSLIGFLIGGELKFNVLKKYGKQFIGILLFESITPFFIVGGIVTTVSYLITKDIITSVSMGLVLGAICSATAPAATTDVLVEYRTRGPLTTTVYGIVAMDDAVALILYAIASTIASTLLGGKNLSLGVQLLTIAKDIFGSILVGSFFGFVLSLIVKNVMKDEGRILSFSLGCLFLSTGTCVILGLDNILAAMSLGFFMVNFAPAKTRSVFTLVTKFTPPVYVLFFVLVGAKLNIWIITPYLGLIALIYVIGRTFGKTIGSIFGAWITKAPATVRKYLPYCLLSQAGVAIGLSIAAGNDFPDSIGPQILLIITATTFIVQLLGPVCVKHGVTKAGECGLNITEEDIIKNTAVKDITWGNLKICDANSPAIVSETTTIKDILDSFSRYPNLNYVVRKDDKLIGVISLEHLKEVLQIGELAESLLATDIMDVPLTSCKPATTLPEAYELFEKYDAQAIPIVDDEQKPLGILEKTAIDHYIHTRILELHRKIEKLG
ncbi:MAG: cation:proton antiporter [Treponema sp.]|uniref:cation:proton antiporter domain-containing protein n=1 Tax=Treponema sp. TaxID=166 RepID=UPI00298DDD64|nr:cation:proton antiporter [Treponema sp.]MBR5933882.1 cation:proton antiporter [Treponema sp.]